jgi:hypothetical protein
MLKRIFSVVFVALGLTVIGATSAPQQADAQVVYCGHCCGHDAWGNLVIGCTLVQAYPCGAACECSNVPGVGVTCY